MITDTHTHLYSEQFDQDRDAMIQRAKDAVVHNTDNAQVPWIADSLGDSLPHQSFQQYLRGPLLQLWQRSCFGADVSRGDTVGEPEGAA